MQGRWRCHDKNAHAILKTTTTPIQNNLVLSQLAREEARHR
jgi:hypothetical protein